MGLTLDELIALAFSGDADPEQRVLKLYEWHREEVFSILRGLLGLASALLVALVPPYFQGLLTVSLEPIVEVAGVALLPVVVVCFLELAWLKRDFATASAIVSGARLWAQTTGWVPPR